MENDFLIRESGTHYTIRLPVEGHNLVVMVEKETFTITIPNFEYMFVPSIVKIIVELYNKEELKDNPVITKFLKFLQEPENKEELKSLQKIYRQLN